VGSTVNIGIVGTRAIAQVAHLPSFQKVRDARIVALCDTDEARVRQLASRFQVPKVFLDYERLLQRDDIDAVVIATPTHLHAPIALAAMDYGKHVLCEKPMALNAEEAVQMARKASQTGCKLMVALNHRFRPDVQLLKREVDGGRLGEFYYVKTGWLRRRTKWSQDHWTAHREEGGGSLLNLGAHLLEVTLWLCGDVKSVVSSMFIGSEKGVDETAVALLRLEGGATQVLEVGWSLLNERDFAYLSIFATKGAATLNPLRIHHHMRGQVIDATPRVPSSKSEGVYTISYDLQAAHFVRSIKKDTQPPFDAWEGVKLAEVIDAIYRSAQEEREIEVKARWGG
jgi:predicted dehydrogenase